ncbi:MAG: hypothetical protein IKO25_08410 [Clostridia bacterium]|nr:hypothetical protein [Clostridia bacterium]
MAEFTKELYENLLNAQSREEVESLLKAEGITDPTPDEVWAKIQEKNVTETEAKALSFDELDDVAGGVSLAIGGTRDWFTQGCAATVEEGSDCWGTDGGCEISNIEYFNMPNAYCVKCGRSCFRNVWYSNAEHEIKCRSCGVFKTTIML